MASRLGALARILGLDGRATQAWGEGHRRGRCRCARRIRRHGGAGRSRRIGGAARSRPDQRCAERGRRREVSTGDRRRLRSGRFRTTTRLPLPLALTLALQPGSDRARLELLEDRAGPRRRGVRRSGRRRIVPRNRAGPSGRCPRTRIADRNGRLRQSARRCRSARRCWSGSQLSGDRSGSTGDGRDQGAACRA